MNNTNTMTAKQRLYIFALIALILAAVGYMLWIIIGPEPAANAPGAPTTGEQVSNEPTVTPDVSGSPSPSASPTAAPKATAKPTVTAVRTVTEKITRLVYSDALNQYAAKKFQFNELCQANPNHMTLSSGATIMIDNRTPNTLPVRLDGIRFTLSGYGFKLFTLQAPSTPYRIQIDCGSGKNNAWVDLQ